MVMADLDSRWSTTFSSTGINFCIRRLAFCFLRFLVTVVKPVCEVFEAATASQETVADVVVIEAEVGMSWS